MPLLTYVNAHCSGARFRPRRHPRRIKVVLQTQNVGHLAVRLAPADASAAFFAGVAPLTMKLAPGSTLEERAERRIADPIVRPGEPRPQRQHGAAMSQRGRRSA
jgi:hypothetical protein